MNRRCHHAYGTESTREHFSVRTFPIELREGSGSQPPVTPCPTDGDDHVIIVGRVSFRPRRGGHDRDLRVFRPKVLHSGSIPLLLNDNDCTTSESEVVQPEALKSRISQQDKGIIPATPFFPWIIRRS